MMPHAHPCAQCAAPLPPGATRCSYCGFITPWGATHAATEQRAAAIQAEQAKKVRVAKAVGTARTGMILALVGLPICCAPLSLAGAGLGYKGARLARAEGIARPVTSVISMIVGALSLALFVTFTILFVRDQQAKDDRLDAVRARLEGKRTAAVLDAKVACDIVEEHLLATGYDGKTLGLQDVHCDGALTTNDRRATITDVRFSYNQNHSTVTACLERRSRWFVLRLLDGGSCADLPPPAPFTPPARAFSQAEATADEVKARADLDKAAHASIVKAFVEKLSKVRAHALAQPGGETVCSRADMASYVTGNERRKVGTADLDFLDAGGSGAADDWPFLTSETLRRALDKARSENDRAKAIAELRAESGPLLVVYKADKKAWPTVSGTDDVADADFSYKGGVFSGWLFIYDTDTTLRRCQTRLQAASSKEVNFKTGRFSSEKMKAKEAIEADFRERFESAATDAIRLAAPDLRLGYKTVE